MEVTGGMKPGRPLLYRVACYDFIIFGRFSLAFVLWHDYSLIMIARLKSVTFANVSLFITILESGKQPNV